MTAGLVVAGGYSTRFGLAEKALVEVGNEPMLCSVVRALEGVVDEVVIDCRADQVAPFETALGSSEIGGDPTTFAIDDAPDRGPIAGLATGLDAIGEHHETTVVVSCDRPGVTPTLLAHLQECRRSHGVEAAVPERDGLVQPLCGVYGTDRLATAVAAAQRAGDRRLLRIPASLDALVVPERSLSGIAPAGALESVDAPFDASRHPVARRCEPGSGLDRPDVPELSARASN